ncbi:MAG: flagellar hook capping FlgD N-terminal domain-containing protein [Clostridiaceae bacterium]|nr:flagellar hook capping FlgD N-terminal domain-containing protein [Clostridiaceae bacterium]
MPVTGADFTYSGSSIAGSESLRAAEALSQENSTLSMNDFFKLLTAQMQNQTMYDSVDTSEYMSQLVQYTTLAQLQELTSSAATSYAVSLVGKEVDVVTADDNGEEMVVSGTVDTVTFQDGTPYIRVGDVYYQTSDILSVRSGT